jgi:hypothetical protein
MAENKIVQKELANGRHIPVIGLGLGAWQVLK